MRILCLHGAGTNSRIFEMQTGRTTAFSCRSNLTETAAIRYELADRHVYDFVEGTIPWSMYPGVETIALDNEPVFAYFDDKDPQSGLAIYQHFEQHLRDEGPYDGVVAFRERTEEMALTARSDSLCSFRSSGRRLTMRNYRGGSL
ncbi:hypothetical protein CNMCM8980_001472 [Aspergillus fumigatiaffinis]|nr:hypothetical protein CNMCM8980_001472 [Aspergillus fumigatiaffinis]